MALTATVYNFDIELSNVDRGVYERLKVQVARHPSESMPFMLARLTAYCLEYEPGIAFSKGLADPDCPAIWAHDQTGQVRLWLEVGHPSSDRLHKASKRAARVVVYSHRDPELFISARPQSNLSSGKIEIRGFEVHFLARLESLIERRSSIQLSLSDQRLYLNIGGKSFETNVEYYKLHRRS